MADRELDTTQNFTDLTEDEVLAKLEGMKEEEKTAAVFNTVVAKITQEWISVSEAHANRAVNWGDHVTQDGNPDLLTLFGGMIAYHSMFETAVAEIAREELMNQSEDSQTLVQQLDKLTSHVTEVGQALIRTSDLMEWALALHLISRELRQNINEDGTFTPLTEFEEERVEKARLVKEEDV